MKRLLAFVSAVAICFSSLSFSYADTSKESGVSAQSNDTTIVDVVNVYSCYGYSNGTGYPAVPAQRIETADAVYYRFTATPNSDNAVAIIFEFAEPMPIYSTDYFSFSYTNYPDMKFGHQYVGNDLETVGWFTQRPGTYKVSPYSTDYSDYFMSFNIRNDYSSQSYRYYSFVAQFSTTDPVTLTIGPLYKSSSFLSEPPTLPGFEDEDGWLGQLITSILGGIQQLIDGLGEVGSQITGAVTNIGNQISNAVGSLGDTISGFWNSDQTHNSEVDSAISDIEQQDQQMGAVEDKYLGDFNSQQSEMSTTLSTFQWPTDITSGMAWITIQMNTIWSGLGGNIQMLFTFSMILGLGLIFLGRWRA